jgi:hypothetical protein
MPKLIVLMAFDRDPETGELRPAFEPRECQSEEQAVFDAFPFIGWGLSVFLGEVPNTNGTPFAHPRVSLLLLRSLETEDRSYLRVWPGEMKSHVIRIQSQSHQLGTQYRKLVVQQRREHERHVRASRYDFRSSNLLLLHLVAIRYRANLRPLQETQDSRFGISNTRWPDSFGSEP